MTIKRNYGNANFGPLLVEGNAWSYSQFLDKVTTGDAKLHANTLMPYEIITPFFRRNVSDEERKAINTTWISQENFGDTENALAIIDGSGSMYGGADPTAEIVCRIKPIYNFKSAE